MEPMTRRRRTRRTSAWLAFGTVVATLWIVAFLWVFVGQWSAGPNDHDNATEWWRDFALPRAAWSLLVGVPLALLAGGAVRRSVVRRAGRG
jgi:ABC-type Fe3+ transport system permease subunit